MVANGLSRTQLATERFYVMPLRDSGKFVGRYFQALAWLSIASMIVIPIFFDHIHIDLTFILLFWAAGHLIRHNSTARKWTLGLTGFCVATITLMLVYAMIAGTDEMTIRFGARIIENPSLWQVAGVAGVFIILAGLPLSLLLTPKAKREFGEAINAMSQMQ